MRATGYRHAGPITATHSLIDIHLPDPIATGRDILVDVKAISVNPADAMVRAGVEPAEGETRILGFDAAGIVKAVGEAVTLFRPGDEVFYAGSVARPGTNSELHLVDERIVGNKPKSLSFAEAAALPLTTITAYEALFDRLDVNRPTADGNRTILITGGAGGVGSIAIQLAKQLTDLTIVTTASRPDSREWVRELGADHVLDHSKPLAPQYAELGLQPPAFVFSLTHSDEHAPDLAQIIAPQGRFALIDNNQGRFNPLPFMSKAVSIHWEMMFARPLYQTPDMIEQHKLLNRVAGLVDEGRIRTTLAETFGRINAESLKKAHAAIESGKTRGKIVLEGF